MAVLRLTGAGRLPRRSLSVPVARTHAPTLQSIPDARSVGATDPRWVVAARAAAQLQGGQAAILAPDQRRRLVAMAEHLGLRAFDAGLIIAIVQDAVRCGLDPLGATSEGSLSLVRDVAPDRDGGRAAGLMLASVCLGAVLFCGLLAWMNMV